MSLVPDKSCCRLHTVFGQTVVSEKWGFPPRRNKDQHMIYIRRGEGYYLLEQKGKLRRIDFEPGMVIFVPAGTLHGASSSNRENRPRIVPIRFGFYPPLSHDLWGRYAGSEDMINTKPREPVVYSTRLSSWWRETFDRICRVHGEERYLPGAEEACGCLIESLLHQLGLAQINPERKTGIESFYRIRQLMDDNCEENYPLSWFSRQADLSEKHFQKRFRELFNQSPMAYYRQKRMERSVTLLQDTQMSVDDVGLLLGYCDGFSFSRAFNAYYGFRPRTVRS